MKPTYRKLNNYDHLVDPAVFKNYSRNHGNLELTLEAIKEVVLRFRKQVYRLSRHLKGDSLQQSAYNLWHWEKNNLHYAPDGEGEELRTPARAFQDGKRNGPGVDCDCLTIFGASILLNNGYPITMNIVAMNNNPNYGHIFLTVGNKSTYHPQIKGYVIDPCPPLTEFDQIAPNITKVMKLSMENGLSGMQAAFNKSGADTASSEELESPNIFGLQGFAAPDSITIQLLARQQQLKRLLHEAPFNIENLREMRKVSFLIGLNGMPEERAKILAIMPYVQDISSEGKYIFRQGMQPEMMEAYLSGNLSEEDLGNLFKNITKGISHAASAVGKSVAKAAKAVAEEIKKDAGKALKFVVKFTPIMILMRSGVKAAMFENVHGAASKLNIGLMTQQEAAAKGYNSITWKQRNEEVNHLTRQFKDIGGEEGKLHASIRQGAGKKMLFGLQEMEGLGEPITLAAGITAASAILIPLFTKLGKGDKGKQIMNADGSPKLDANGNATYEKPENPITKLAATLGYDSSKSFLDNVESFGKTVKDMTHSIVQAPGAINTTKATIGIVGVGLMAAILLGRKKNGNGNGSRNSNGSMALLGVFGSKKSTGKALAVAGSLAVGGYFLMKRKTNASPSLPNQYQPPVPDNKPTWEEYLDSERKAGHPTPQFNKSGSDKYRQAS